jgi:hypothetical protein
MAVILCNGLGLCIVSRRNQIQKDKKQETVFNLLASFWDLSYTSNQQIFRDGGLITWEE